jgi:hypothetical protein
MATATIGTGGTYTTPESWEDALPATLTEPEVGRLLAQSHDLAGALSFSGHTTSATNTITLESAPGAGWGNSTTHPMRPQAANGAILTCNVYSAHVLYIDNSNIVIQGIQVRNDGDDAAGIYATGAATNTTVDRCLIQASPSGGLAVVLFTNDAKFRNNAAINRSASGAGRGVWMGGGGICVNNTVVRPVFLPGANGGSDYGLWSEFVNTLARNNAVFGFNVPAGGGAYGAGTTNNATDEASFGAGSANLTGLTATNQFNDVGSTSGWATAIDLRLKAGSALIDAGATDATNAPTDAYGTVRPQGSAYDIGAYEAAAATPAPEPMAPGVASFVSSGPAGISGSATEATGGTAPYAKQWERSTTSGSGFTDLAGKTALTFTDTTAAAGTVYYYRLRYTDSAGTPAVATSNEFDAEVYMGGAMDSGPGSSVTYGSF